MWKKRCGVFVCATVAMAAAVTASEREGESPGATQFARMKSLVGDWVGTTTHGDEIHAMAVSYRLTAGGSALLETLHAGTEKEMLTVYFLDGDRLVLTHYCVLGNQPEMAATAGADASAIRFEFRGGANIDAQVDQHMHDAVIQFVTDDFVRSEWTMFEGGAPAMVATMELRRKVAPAGPGRLPASDALDAASERARQIASDKAKQVLEQTAADAVE